MKEIQDLKSTKILGGVGSIFMATVIGFFIGFVLIGIAVYKISKALDNKNIINSYIVFVITYMFSTLMQMLWFVLDKSGLIALIILNVIRLTSGYYAYKYCKLLFTVTKESLFSIAGKFFAVGILIATVLSLSQLLYPIFSSIISIFTVIPIMIIGYILLAIAFFSMHEIVKENG